MENICLFWIAIILQNYTLMQLMALEEKLKTHSEMLKLPSNIYSKVYPTGFSPSKLYGTAKIHEIDTNGKVDYLPVIPIILNNVTLNIVPPCKVFGRAIETFQ